MFNDELLFCQPRNAVKTRLRLLLPLLVAALWFGTSPAAADQPRLFRDFNFGMPKSELLELPNVYDCSAELGEDGWLCLPEGGDTFANTDVEVAFALIDGIVVLGHFGDRILRTEVFGLLRGAKR